MYIYKIFIQVFSILLFFYLEVSGETCRDPYACSTDEYTCTVKFNPITIAKVPDSKLPTKYDSQGLQPFFNLANSFMNTVQSKRFDKHFKDFDTDNFESDENRELIKDYEIPIAVAAGFGLLFALLMPIIGFCFCCCRCCGKCGGTMNHHPKQAKKHGCCCAMAVALLLVTILMLCGVLFMFVTNNRLHSTYQDVGPTYEEVIDEAVNFANATVTEVKSVANEQLPCIIGLVKDDLGQLGVETLIGKPIKALVTTNISGVIAMGLAESKNITKIGNVLTEIKDTSDVLKSLASDLNNALTNINSKIQDVKTECDAAGQPALAPTCDDIGNINVATNIDYNQFPDVDTELSNINDIISKNLTKQIEEANKIVNDIPSTVASKSATERANVVKTVDDTKKTVTDSVNDISKDIDKETVDRRAEYLEYKHDYLNKTSKYSKYEDYRWYVYIGLSAVMALIVILMGCGLTLGTVGYRKDRSPTQRRGIATCGGNCLMAAVGFMFLFAFIFMIFCVIWFVVGIHLHIVCRDIEDAQPLDEFLPSDIRDKVVFSQSLKNCRQNQPLYTAINGEKIFNITDEFDVRKQAKTFDEDLDKINFDLSDQTVVTADAQQVLTNIQTAGINSINYTKFFNTLNEKITETNLTKLIEDLEKYKKLATDNSQNALATSISNVVTDVTNLKNGIIVNIETNVTKLDGQVKTLQEMTTYILPRATAILNQFLASQEYVQKELVPEIKELIKKYANRMIGWLEQGSAHLINQAKTNMARCKPVANIYDGAINTFMCENVVQNANGFWLALGWCLLFFIPAIILCVRLAKFFRKMDYESGREDDINHPPYNDKIPLQSRPPPYTTMPLTGSRPPTLYTEERPTSALVDNRDDYDDHPPPPYEHNNDGYQYQ